MESTTGYAFTPYRCGIFYFHWQRHPIPDTRDQRLILFHPKDTGSVGYKLAQVSKWHSNHWATWCPARDAQSIMLSAKIVHLKYNMSGPGIEPRTTACQVGVLTTTLPRLLWEPCLWWERRLRWFGLCYRVKNTWHAFSRIFQEGGVRGLWKGWMPNVQRAALVNLGGEVRSIGRAGCLMYRGQH